MPQQHGIGNLRAVSSRVVEPIQRHHWRGRALPSPQTKPNQTKREPGEFTGGERALPRRFYPTNTNTIAITERRTDIKPPVQHPECDPRCGAVPCCVVSIGIEIEIEIQIEIEIKIALIKPNPTPAPAPAPAPVPTSTSTSRHRGRNYTTSPSSNGQRGILPAPGGPHPVPHRRRREHRAGLPEAGALRISQRAALRRDHRPRGEPHLGREARPRQRQQHVQPRRQQRPQHPARRPRRLGQADMGRAHARRG
ncbi:hypothetical protein NUW58_g5602 [Xylaria curta]|uniref:Uncharacterized protein n=1 Tax=Xylaria curta TaxID=42375 RepID=A0ACC1P3G8_9PEZI|nr:hypothetical protein NUW58_g5602 [Xylaria curta]